LGEEKKKPGEEFNAETAEDAEGAEKRGDKSGEKKVCALES
jgi:hypothetical protein